jgi:uncharacterized membrane protein
MIHKIIDWLYFLFWMIGIFTISCLKLNFKDAVEVTYWIRIHLKYTGQCVEYTKRTFYQKIKNDLIVFLGILIIFGVIYLLIYNVKILI